MKKTFAYQHQLPSLPVPPLNSTKAKLIEWIEPLLSREQYQRTTNVIEQFFAEGGQAAKLQEKLLAWDHQESGSWLTPFWDDVYLKHRDSLPVTSNFNVLLQHDEKQKHLSVAELAGRISTLVTELYHDIIDEKIAPSMVRGQLLDMSQYKDFFRSVRIPQKNRDIFQVAAFSKENNHVVLLYKNKVYKVPVTNELGEHYHEQQIASSIETMVLSDKETGINVGIYTAAERDVAANVYEKLSMSKVNTETLQTIADSLVIISIDEESENPEEAIKNLMLHPDSKFFDKTIQVVITKYGQLGFNMEHSSIDGTSVSTVINYISKKVRENKSDPILHQQMPLIEKKEWVVSEELYDLLAQIELDYMQHTNEYSLLPKNFTDFGAEQIKALNLSPDAFFHMALQLAQYRTYGELKSVYEPVSVRFFQEGRTECARATSMEKRNLVEAIENGQENNEALYALMQIASDAHAKRIKDCQLGLGVERHLFGLEKMYDLFGEQLGMEQLPEIFRDEGYNMMRHDFISTSGMVYDGAIYRMFAPVVKNGHGLAYILSEHSISMNISIFIDNEFQGNLLKKHLMEALNELRMIALHEQTKDIA